jgi:hypothetical protein
VNLDLSPHLPAMRETAESLMVDTVDIARWDGFTYDRNEATGAETKVYNIPVYTGKARIQQRAAVAMEEEGGGRTVTTLRLELQLPITATDLQVDDQVTVTAATHDADLTDRVFRVSALHHKTHATARRVAIEEVTS